ncbi:MAG: 2-iminoacetate synthase ThiH [Verrucomicrobiales bacterium]|nr:2-iminoacetate synthase ThiH [Verrucomicrobiales bacterium]
MSFVQPFNQVTQHGQRSPLLSRFESLIAPASPEQIESLAQRSVALTRQHFGKTMRLFAPLYLSNECINNCSYCGFSRDNPILRVTLAVDQVEREARFLAEQGFRNILLVAGEHPKFVSNGYLENCIAAIRSYIPTVALEVGPMETPEYQRMVDSGSEGLVVYQETYDREVYQELHTAGPKRHFDWRLECPERAYDAGFRRIGIGALLGLADWRSEALALAAHLEYLYKTCWKASFTISFPRMRPAAGEFTPPYTISDAELIQLITVFRITFPQLGIVLSTREPAPLRDALFPLGVTTISAGSHTEPGGYTGEGKDDLHLTVRGRRQELDQATAAASSCSSTSTTTAATGQFDIADHRSAAEIAAVLKQLSLEPVWKDWDSSILSPAPSEEIPLKPTPSQATPLTPSPA